HLHGRAQEIELERSVRVSDEAEAAAIERGRRATAGGRVRLVREPRVLELVLDDAQAVVDHVGRRAELDQPQRQVLRDRGGAVLGGDARAPLGADAIRRSYCGHGTSTSRGGGGLQCAPGGQWPPPMTSSI